MGLKPTEKKLYRILRGGGPYSLEELTEKYNKGKKRQAKDTTINSMLKGIMKKEKSIKCTLFDSGEVYYIENEPKAPSDDASGIYTRVFISDEEPELDSQQQQLIDLLRNGDRWDSYNLAKEIGCSEDDVESLIDNLIEVGANIEEKELTQSKMQYYIPTLTLAELINESKFEMPRTSYLSPHEITVKDSDHPRVAFANTLNVGEASSKKMFHNFLRFCEKENNDAVVITGNLISMNLKDYPTNIKDIASVSSLEIDHKKVRYPKNVVLDGRDPQKVSDEGKPLYLDIGEKLDMIVENQLKELFIDENENPLYSGPVYILFGDKEDELHNRYLKKVMKDEVERERSELSRVINLIKDRKKKYNKLLTNLENTVLKEVEAGLNEEVPKKDKVNLKKQYTDSELQDIVVDNLGEDKARYNEIREAIVHLDEKQSQYQQYQSRVLLRNMDENYINLASKAVLGFLVEKIERAIPNSKVIGSGNAYLKAGEKIIRVVHDPRPNSKTPSDTLMNYLIRIARDESSNGEDLPDAIVAGGLSPVGTKIPSADVDESGDKVTNLYQLPTMLDRDYLYELISQDVRAKETQKKLAKQNCEMGALILEWPNGIPKHKELTDGYLTNDEEFTPEGIKDYQLMYEANTSDYHFGSKYVTLFETDDDVLYFLEVLQRFLKDTDAPIVRLLELGDKIQGKNYDTELEHHPEYLRPSEMTKRFLQIDKEFSDPMQAAIEKSKLAKRNIIRSGIIDPQLQYYELLSVIDWDLFGQILQNGRDIGLYGPKIVFTEGNHSQHTAGSFVYSLDLKMRAQQMLNAKDNEIDASVIGSITIAETLFGILNNPDLTFEDALEAELGDYYLYAEHIRHKQGSSKTNDPMKASTNAFDKRGRTFKGSKGRYTINRKGHDHRGGFSVTRSTIQIGCYCGQDRNSYGEEKDYPLSTIGFNITGLPVKGPAAGPIVNIDVYHRTMNDWINGRLKVDKEKLYENSIL